MKQTRRCRHCDKDKPLAAFNWRSRKKGIRQTKCKDCQSAYHRQHYQANKTRYIKKARRWDAENKAERQDAVRRYIVNYLLEHPCVDCGETDPIVLDFDHVRGKKRFNVSAMISLYYDLAYIKAEIAKCEVRCANCHRIKTAREQSWYFLDYLAEYQMQGD